MELDQRYWEMEFRRRPAAIMMTNSGRTTQSRMSESRRRFWDDMPDRTARLGPVIPVIVMGMDMEALLDIERWSGTVVGVVS